jgi:hypothetical protein
MGDVAGATTSQGTQTEATPAIDEAPVPRTGVDVRT